MEPKTLLQFLEDYAFADDFGWEIVMTRNGICFMIRKAVKILFLMNRPSKFVPTCMELFIGGRAWHGTKNTFAIP